MRPQALGSFLLATRKSQNGAKSSAGSATSMYTLFRSVIRSCAFKHHLTDDQAKPKSKLHADPEKLSHHVHRVGHHFPLEIVQLACSKFGYTYDEAHGLRKAKTSNRINWIAQSMEKYSTRQQALHGRPSTEKETKDYIHGAVREMFPKIPEADLSSIVNHAFQKVHGLYSDGDYSAYMTQGTNRVGNAKELSLARRVQLAVVAHIRHTYTDYDKLLKTDGWMTARSQVEHVSLTKLKEWRDEADEQSNELEETFREVIVLDDDESSGDESLSFTDEREQSMEIFSNRATARDLQPERYIDHPPVDLLHDTRRAPRRTIALQKPPPPPPRTTYPGPSSLQPPFEVTRPRAHPVDSHPSSHVDPYRFAHSRPSDPYVGVLNLSALLLILVAAADRNQSYLSPVLELLPSCVRSTGDCMK